MFGAGATRLGAGGAGGSGARGPRFHRRGERSGVGARRGRGVGATNDANGGGGPGSSRLVSSRLRRAPPAALATGVAVLAAAAAAAAAARRRRRAAAGDGDDDDFLFARESPSSDPSSPRTRATRRENLRNPPPDDTPQSRPPPLPPMDADEHHAAVDGWIDRWREDPPRIGFHLDRVHEKLTRHKTRLLGEGVTSPPETSKRVLVPLCGKSVDMTYLASCGHRVYGIEISTEAIEAFFDDAGLPRSVDDADAHARPRARAGAGSGLGSRDDDDGFGFGFDEDWRGAKNVKRVHSSGNIAIAEGDLFGLGVWTGRRDGSEGPRAARRGGRGEGRRHFFLNDDDDDDDDGLDDAFDDDDDADADARVGARGSISFREEALRFAAGGGPRMDAVYDRGALVAVEPSLRERYAAVVAQRMAPGAKMLLIGVAYDASSQHSNGSSPDVTAGAAEEGEHRKTSDNEPFFLGGPPYSLTAAEVRALYEPRGVDVVEILASEERVESAPPRLRERGVTSMIETTYLLRKRRHAEEKRKRRRRGGRGLIGG